MAPVKDSPRYREWLTAAIEKSGLSKREIARRMAASHPRGVTAETIETYRRTLRKIVAGDLTPTQPTRDLIASALERDDSPGVNDDEEEEPSDLNTALLILARQQAELDRNLKRVAKAIRAKELVG